MSHRYAVAFVTRRLAEAALRKRSPQIPMKPIRVPYNPGFPRTSGAPVIKTVKPKRKTTHWEAMSVQEKLKYLRDTDI